VALAALALICATPAVAEGRGRSRTAPPDPFTRLHLHGGHGLVAVADVFFVEAATNVIHDVPTEVLR
jgi:hypothetical protein